MGVLTKMIVATKTEAYGLEYPPEHYNDDHWFSSMAKGEGQKCNCEYNNNGVSNTEITMRPVYDTTPGHENHLFWQATPSGEVKLSIANRQAAAQFEVGVEYYVEMRKARK